MIEHIFVDMDGVLANFIESAYDLHGQTYDPQTYPKGDWNGLLSELGINDKDLWKSIRACKGFWKNISPYPWVGRLLACAKLRAPVSILSHADDHPSCYSGKREWADKHCRGYELILCKSKQFLAGPGRLLIDDKDENVKLWIEKGGSAILFPQPWNQNHDKAGDPIGYAVSHLAVRDSNPKDLVGSKKPPINLVPSTFLVHLAQVMKNGAEKYGSYNWRIHPVTMSAYIGAALRHITAINDGEDVAQDSGLPHAAHAAACMAIILDSAATGCLIDDRPGASGASELIKCYTESQGDGKWTCNSTPPTENCCP